MMISNIPAGAIPAAKPPAPAGAPAAPSAQPGAAPAPPGAAPSAPAAPAATPAPGAPGDNTKPGTNPSGAGSPADAAAAKQQVIDELMQTTAGDALGKVDSHLQKIASLTVGGGTPEGTQGAKVASALLTDASMLLQHAHMKAMEQLRTIAGELHLKLMSSASGLAYMGGQVAIAGQSKQPVKLAEIAAAPIAETKATMQDVLAALGGSKPAGDGAGSAPASGAPDAKPAPDATPAPDAKPADGRPAPIPTAPAANGNGGVAGPVLGAPPHVQGPGTGTGPNPA